MKKWQAVYLIVALASTVLCYAIVFGDSGVLVRQNLIHQLSTIELDVQALKKENQYLEESASRVFETTPVENRASLTFSFPGNDEDESRWEKGSDLTESRWLFLVISSSVSLAGYF